MVYFQLKIGGVGFFWIWRTVFCRLFPVEKIVSKKKIKLIHTHFVAIVLLYPVTRSLNISKEQWTPTLRTQGMMDLDSLVLSFVKNGKYYSGSCDIHSFIRSLLSRQVVLFIIYIHNHYYIHLSNEIFIDQSINFDNQIIDISLLCRPKPLIWFEFKYSIHLFIFCCFQHGQACFVAYKLSLVKKDRQEEGYLIIQQYMPACTWFSANCLHFRVTQPSTSFLCPHSLIFLSLSMNSLLLLTTHRKL